MVLELHVRVLSVPLIVSVHRRVHHIAATWVHRRVVISSVAHVVLAEALHVLALHWIVPHVGLLAAVNVFRLLPPVRKLNHFVLLVLPRPDHEEDDSDADRQEAQNADGDASDGTRADISDRVDFIEAALIAQVLVAGWRLILVAVLPSWAPVLCINIPLQLTVTILLIGTFDIYCCLNVVRLHLALCFTELLQVVIALRLI